MKDEADLPLEVVILLVLGLFMLLFGILLFKINAGQLSYNPDSTYGLFLVIVSFQVITMGKTPFGDLRRSWLLIAIGICAAIFGMFTCFIPGYVTRVAQLLIGLLLVAGGATLLVRLFVVENTAREWMTIGGMLRQLTVACALTYVLTILTGVATLFPGAMTDFKTASLLVVYGLSFFYLSWCVWKVRSLHPPAPVPATATDAAAERRPHIFREASLPLSLAILIVLGILLTLLGLLLFPVNLGLIPFSPDGQLGLLLVLISIQMMSLGDTPLGQFKRSWLILAIGLLFAALGVVASIVPGLLTAVIQILVGVLNIAGGAISLVKLYLPVLRQHTASGRAPAVPPGLIKLAVIQTTLNCVQIAFGAAMLVPGIVPGLLIAGILVINGLLLFVLASALPKVTAAA